MKGDRLPGSNQFLFLYSLVSRRVINIKNRSIFLDTVFYYIAT